MPIRGLTDRQSATPRFTRLGKIKKGEIRNDRPVDLDYFRFVAEGPEVAAITDAFETVYGGEPREITIYLPYKTVEENWQTWMEEWGKSGLIHRCDGEFMTQWINGDKTYVRDPEQKQAKPCPYASGEKERTDKNPGCTQIGRLAAIVPELVIAGFVGYVTVEIHSKNDLANINNSVLDAEGKAETAGRPNGLQGIEFRLRRVPETIGIRYEKTVKRNGKSIGTGEFIKTQGEKWMVRLDPAREWVLKQLETSKQQALGYSAQRPALVMDVEPVTITAVDGADLTPDDALDAPFEIIEGAVVEENTEPETEEINPETTKEAEAPDATPNAWKKWGEWFKLAKESGLTLTALQDDTDLWTLEAATEAVRKAVSGIQQGKDLETAQTWLNEQLSAKA